LDRETRDTIHLTVMAVDSGSPQLTGTVAVTINVEDVNDNPPSFPTSAILANVRENLPAGTKIRRIVAQDSDLGDNGKIEYSLKGTEDFKIDPDSGDLFTNVKLDRETKDSYTVSWVIKSIITTGAEEAGVTVSRL
jgi:Cadherin domain